MIFRIPFTLLMFYIFFTGDAYAQDSLQWQQMDTATKQVADTIYQKPLFPPDSVSRKVILRFGLYDTSIKKRSGSAYGVLAGNLLQSDNRLKSAYPPAYEPSLSVRIVEDRDWIFYLFCAFLLFLALLNISFRKYFQDLFRVMLNTSLRQKQIREQLAQAPLPSLLLNFYFFISSGVFLYFLLNQLNIQFGYGIIGSMLLCTAIPAFIYLGKYLILKTIFWIFDRSEAAESYLFIVFLINKVAGIFLLPFSILLAYASVRSIGVILTLVVIGLILLIGHRLLRGYDTMKTYLSLNLFHYLLFVAGFEFVPLLLIYKLLMHVIE